MIKAMDVTSAPRVARVGWLEISAAALLLIALAFSIWSVSKEGINKTIDTFIVSENSLESVQLFATTPESSQGKPVALLQGQPLFLVEGEEIELARNAVTLVGRVDAGRYFLFQANNPELNTGTNGEIYYFTPAVSGKYLRVTSTAPENFVPNP